MHSKRTLAQPLVPSVLSLCPLNLASEAGRVGKDPGNEVALGHVVQIDV